MRYSREREKHDARDVLRSLPGDTGYPGAAGSDADSPTKVGVALVDVPVERGCMTFIPGSHRRNDLRAIDLTDAKDLFEAAPDLAYEQRVTVPNKRNVTISKIEPVGNYAVRIVFDDFHDTGIFTWDYLHTLGHVRDARWQSYIDELEQKGLSRG